jgi:hypothetical protein
MTNPEIASIIERLEANRTSLGSYRTSPSPADVDALIAAYREATKLPEGDIGRMAEQLRTCGESWEPDACLLGNVTAAQVVTLCTFAAKAQASSDNDRQVAAICSEQHIADVAALAAADELAEACELLGGSQGIRTDTILHKRVVRVRAYRKRYLSARNAAPDSLADDDGVSCVLCGKATTVPDSVFCVEHQPERASAMTLSDQETIDLAYSAIKGHGAWVKARVRDAIATARQEGVRIGVEAACLRLDDEADWQDKLAGEYEEKGSSGAASTSWRLADDARGHRAAIAALSPAQVLAEHEKKEADDE